LRRFCERQRLGLFTILHAGIVVAVVASGICVHAATFKAAVAKADITPPPGVPMYGFLDRLKDHKFSTGTLDPLYARVLVIEAGNKRLALITLDLGRTFNQAELVQLRERVRKSAQISYLLVTASHTHSGPNILDRYPDDRPPAWETNALDKIVTAVSEAAARLADAQINTGRGQVYIGYNRRQVHSDNRVTMIWSNPERRPTSPLDPSVLVMRIDDITGMPLAILVNYACHPVVFGADNLEYSADYVAKMRSTVETAFGNKPLCFFLQGADGDINPYYATTTLADGALARRDWTGEQLGKEAVQVAKAIQTKVPNAPSIDFADDAMSFQFRWPSARFRESLLKTYGPQVFEDHAELIAQDPPRGHLELRVTTLLLNKNIVLVGMPGEPFVDFQISFRDLCPIPNALFLGYTNGYFDYFPTLAAAAEGGYGAADSNTYVEVGAGERMLRHALVRIYEMLGRLTDTPPRD
jgi:neutral ceramidase